MSRLFQTVRTIEVPHAVVWEVVIDVSAWPEWTPTVRSLTRLDGAEFGLGSRVEIRQPRLPKAQWEVTEFIDGESFTWESTAPGIRTIGRHEVTARGGGSEVKLSIEQTGPMGVVAAVVWRSLTQRYVETEAACLERRALELAAG